MSVSIVNCQLSVVNSLPLPIPVVLIDAERQRIQRIRRMSVIFSGLEEIGAEDGVPLERERLLFDKTNAGERNSGIGIRWLNATCW